MKIESKKISIDKLLVNDGQIEGIPKNPRLIKDAKYKDLLKSLRAFPEMLSIREIVVTPFNSEYVILGGNMRSLALKEIGEKNAICKVVSDVSVDKMREFVIKDNEGYGEYDWSIIENDWNSSEIAEWGVDVIELIEKLDNTDVYTNKVESPNYEAKNEKPDIIDLFDDKKQKDLIEEINNADIPDEEKMFLRKAAARHCVFDYSKIADFYANSNNNIKMLMEKSALIILDFNSAIENGYVKLSNEITNQYVDEYETE